MLVPQNEPQNEGKSRTRTNCLGTVQKGTKRSGGVRVVLKWYQVHHFICFLEGKSNVILKYNVRGEKENRHPQKRHHG